MNIHKRLEELERSAGVGSDHLTLFIQFVGSRLAHGGDTPGPVIYPVTGYRTMTGERWDLADGETVEDLKARAVAEVSRSEWGIASLLECYAPELEAA